MEGQKEFVQIDHNDLFPYLLVNIGSGGSMIKVDGDGKFQWVSGTNVGGGTYWGLGRLLTKCKSFDELLELSQRGDNRTIDMLVGDIYSGMDYSKIGLSASTIASSFGKAIRLYCTNALEGPPKLLREQLGYCWWQCPINEEGLSRVGLKISTVRVGCKIGCGYIA
ncbi:pantothenate kinase 1-like isoform X5 [Quercus lobata]|uniref:pantothenate kinase 1-like isoform X5 n=1 Tax=Quercus lobata TaxID=97700 RepID=UPI001243C6E5|nr:pantothenate kinase 1-like isoform X5 [Quercus lobata]